MSQRRWRKSDPTEIHPWVIAILSAVLVLGAVASAQRPIAELPRVYVDTAWNAPKGGTIWQTHTAKELSKALSESIPGDIIVLDAGVTYTGNFTLPAKLNPQNKWIYVISSSLASMPSGIRVSPSSVGNMPKLQTVYTTPVLHFANGSNHWRFAGLEITSTSTQGCNPTHVPPINCFTYALVDTVATTDPTLLPDSVTFDRVYMHGSPTIDLQRAIAANMNHFALVDSYLSDIHLIGTDSQAIGQWQSQGPFKIVNNFLEASTENVIFGGAGGTNQPFVPEDIEVRNNYFFKPLSWVDLSINQHQMVVKNHFELKNARRVLLDGNTFENNWANGQVGFSVLFTVMSSQSGNIAVVEDVTATNNIFKNVASGFNIIAKDYTCGHGPNNPNCTNAGNQDRYYIANNLIQFRDPSLPGGVRNAGLQLGVGTDWVTEPGHGAPGVPKNIVFQHNTMVSAASTPCWNSVIFSINTGQTPIGHVTNNVWILDNVLCREVGGVQGAGPLTNYMGDPSTPPNDLTQRFRGNVMFVPAGSNVQNFPRHNLSTVKAIRFVDPANGNFQLLQPIWTETSDGKLAGIDSATLPK